VGRISVPRGNEKHTADGDGDPRDDRSRGGEFELRDLARWPARCRVQDEQEAEHRQASARLAPVMPKTRPLLCV